MQATKCSASMPAVDVNSKFTRTQSIPTTITYLIPGIMICTLTSAAEPYRSCVRVCMHCILADDVHRASIQDSILHICYVYIYANLLLNINPALIYYQQHLLFAKTYIRTYGIIKVVAVCMLVAPSQSFASHLPNDASGRNCYVRHRISIVRINSNEKYIKVKG